jgi:hypothetical protein
VGISTSWFGKNMKRNIVETNYLKKIFNNYYLVLAGHGPDFAILAGN